MVLLDCPLEQRRIEPAFNMQCAPNQLAREWCGNETLGTERTPMVLVMGLFTNDRILVQFSQALASWERHCFFEAAGPNQKPKYLQVSTMSNLHQSGM